MLSDMTLGMSVRVERCPPEELLVDYLKKLEVRVLVRGIRDARDLDAESDLEQINSHYYPDLETVFLRCKNDLRMVSSGAVRELIFYGADISAFVPRGTEAVLKNRR